MQLFKHGQQYHEYKGIKESVLNCYQPKKSLFIRQFETTENEIKNFVKIFIENGINNEQIKQRLLENLEAIQLDFKPNGVNDRQIITDASGEKHIKNFKRASLGKNTGNGQILTDSVTTRGIIHELGHSISQKFDEEWLNSPEIKHKILTDQPFEKDTSIGEIESKFIEKVFDDFVKNNTKLLVKSGNSFDLADFQLQEEISDLEQYDILDMLGRLTKGIKEDNPDYRQSGEHRYIIGSVMASLLFEDYKKDPEGTLELFNEYLENQCSMDINQTVEFLTKGKAKDFGSAVENYKQMLQEKTTTQTHNC